MGQHYSFKSLIFFPCYCCDTETWKIPPSFPHSLSSSFPFSIPVFLPSSLPLPLDFFGGSWCLPKYNALSNFPFPTFFFFLDRQKLRGNQGIGKVREAPTILLHHSLKFTHCSWAPGTWTWILLPGNKWVVLSAPQPKPHGMCFWPKWVDQLACFS